MSFFSRFAALALSLTLGASAFADTVFLKNGDEIEGEIQAETDMAVVIRDSRTARVLSIRRSEIDLVIRSKRKSLLDALFSAEQKSKGTPKLADEETAEGEGAKAEGENAEGEGAKTEGAKKEGEGAPAGEPGANPEGDKKEGDPLAIKFPELKPEVQKAVDEAWEKMGSENPSEREEAKAALRELGTEVLPALTLGLMHKDAEVRTECAVMLGNMNARNAIKYLIEGLYAALPEDGQAATYQRQYVRALRTALERTTGQAFISVEPNSPLIQDGLKKYIAWYEKEYDRLPAQVGEPEIKPTDPKYAEKLLQVRKLSLAKRTWPRPKLAAEIATGQDAGTQPPRGAVRTEDEKFAKNFPTTDREDAGGYIRDGDKKFADDFFRK